MISAGISRDLCHAKTLIGPYRQPLIGLINVKVLAHTNPDFELDLIVILDNSTRWNSTYNSLKRGLAIKPYIQLFCLQFQAVLSDDALSETDWEELGEIVIALEPFHTATLHVEGRAGRGHHGAVWETLPILEVLLGLMEAGREAAGSSPLAVAHQNAWDKLNKYYNKTDTSHEIYGAATLLHPARRKAYFDEQWTSKEGKAMKNKMIASLKKTWEQEYQGQAPRATTPLEQPKARKGFLDDHFKKVQSATSDPFSAFINAAPTEFADESAENLITWWMKDDNSALRQMALDLISIPAMSAEVERVFSSAKRLITPDRNRLSDTTIEILQLLKYWWNNETVREALQKHQQHQRGDRYSSAGFPI